LNCDVFVAIIGFCKRYISRCSLYLLSEYEFTFKQLTFRLEFCILNEWILTLCELFALNQLIKVDNISV
jgi:hypothetical protein